MIEKEKTLKIPEFFNLLLVLTIVLALVTLLAHSLNYLEQALTQETDTQDNPVTITETIKIGYVGNYGPPSISKSEEPIPRVLAATSVQLPTYLTQVASQSDQEVKLNPGQRTTVWAEFKNTGMATWKSSGPDIVTLVSRSPGSKFQDPFWYTDRIAGKLIQDEVKPGEVGKFRFALQAPQQEEFYLEEFVLAVHGHSILGSLLSLPIKVGDPVPHFQAQVSVQSHNSINIEPGKAITFWVEFKNTGRVTWTNDGEHFVALNVSGPAGRISPFKHDYWNEYYYRPTRLDQKEVKPGEIGRFTFALKAPETEGDYVENFQLVAENLTWFTGGQLVISITVREESRPIKIVEGEEDIRVGLYNTKKVIKVTANGKYEIRNSENKLLTTKGKNVVSKVTYKNGKYSLESGNTSLITTKYLRFIPKNTDTIMEITNYENRPQWNISLNDNRFRGTIEIRYADETEKLWVINELPLEAYLRGLAEAGNDNPSEYLKALVTAARSYAQYHITAYRKHRAENFHVDATYDQVYRGYNFELRAYAITKAQEATRGLMVTYDGEIVFTPYFSRTDGRTRSWEEVWAGGPYPWLVSVPDPWCKGKNLWGHGVGMSAEGARAQAEEGKKYKQILKYYYTGVEVEEIY